MSYTSECVRCHHFASDHRAGPGDASGVVRCIWFGCDCEVVSASGRFEPLSWDAARILDRKNAAGLAGSVLALRNPGVATSQRTVWRVEHVQRVRIDSAPGPMLLLVSPRGSRQSVHLRVVLANYQPAEWPAERQES